MIEYRRLSLQSSETAEGVFRGVAVPYGELSHVLADRARPYRERFERGAIKHTDSTVMIYNHNQGSLPLARVGAGTLRFTETDEGLRFEAELPESATEIREALQRGDMDGSVSIGFIANDDKWNNRTNPAVRTVQSAELIELSVLSGAGAYANAKGSF